MISKPNAIGLALLVIGASCGCESNESASGPPGGAGGGVGFGGGWGAGFGGESAGSGGATGGSAGSTCPAASLAVSNARGGDAPVLIRSSYDYVPSVMHDGVYRMWWCGGIAGDHVLYAEASSLDGPWHSHTSTAQNSFDDVFQPTGNPADFDGLHTCDPSVIRVDGTYYLYYGGLSSNDPNAVTKIGVAQSEDGLSWTRLNAGQPIVSPARDPFAQSLPNKYGAGQPSITFVDGRFYLIFTDTTGYGGNPANGAGQYVLRSEDPTFSAGVEELGADGFAAAAPATHTAFSVLESFSVDWGYADAIDAFVIASDTSAGKTLLHFLDPAGKSLAGSPQPVSGSWTEGPGLVTRPDKHAIPSASCGTIPIDLLRSVGPGGPDTWDLAHDGVDVTTGLGCDCTPLGRIFEGSLLQSPGLPLAMARGGTRLQFELAAPALRLARSAYDVSTEIYQAIPYGASMHQGDPVLGAPGRPAAFQLDDGKLWPVSCLEAITDNGSSITSVTEQAYDAYPVAYSLFCLK